MSKFILEDNYPNLQTFHLQETTPIQLCNWFDFGSRQTSTPRAFCKRYLKTGGSISFSNYSNELYDNNYLQTYHAYFCKNNSQYFYLDNHLTYDILYSYFSSTPYFYWASGSDFHEYEPSFEMATSGVYGGWQFIGIKLKNYDGMNEAVINWKDNGVFSIGVPTSEMEGNSETPYLRIAGFRTQDSNSNRMYVASMNFQYMMNDTELQTNTLSEIDGGIWANPESFMSFVPDVLILWR